MKYLRTPKQLKDQPNERHRVLEALDRLNSNRDWQYVRENLVDETVRQVDATVRDLKHDDVDLPVHQGVARAMSELATISRTARDVLGKLNRKRPTTIG